MSSKHSSSNSSAGGPSAKKGSSSSSDSSGSGKQTVEIVFAASTFDEKTCVYTYRGGWVDIELRIKRLIKSVVIEEGVTGIADKIGLYAGLFQGCGALISIFFPETGSFVKIGSWALSGCTSLKTLTVPDSCVDLEHGALWGCSSLKAFTFPNKCTKLNISLLAGCSSLTNFNIPDDCVEISNNAIGHCTSLNTLAIPNACTQVHWHAMKGCTALQALANKSNLTTQEYYCRKQWRSPRLFAFKVNLFASYNVLNRLRVNDPLLNDPLIDKTSILWVLYDKVPSDDVKRNIMEFLDYKWMGNN